MTGNHGLLTSYRKKFTTQVELGDDSTYKIEGVGSTSLQLDSGTVLHIEYILYVPGLKNILLSVVVIEYKGYKVIFMDRKVLLWENNEKLSSVELIRIREGGIYKASRQSTQALLHKKTNPCDM